MKQISVCLLTLIGMVCLSSCGLIPTPIAKPPAPNDWETEFPGAGPVPVSVKNASSRDVKLRLSDVDGNIASQVELRGNGTVHLRLKCDAYQVKVRIRHADGPKYYLAPPLMILHGTGSASLTLQLANSTNLIEIDEQAFNHRDVLR